MPRTLTAIAIAAALSGCAKPRTTNAHVSDHVLCLATDPEGRCEFAAFEFDGQTCLLWYQNRPGKSDQIECWPATPEPWKGAR